MAVSFIQSLYGAFGSGVVAPGTGVVLQNRGACFAVSGRVEPGRRPYHTIIPGMLLRDGGCLLGPFGVMGGFIQAQAHVQLVSALVDDGSTRRRRSTARASASTAETSSWRRASGSVPPEVEALGLTPVPSADHGTLRRRPGDPGQRDGLVGGSDRRKDGHAAGF